MTVIQQEETEWIEYCNKTDLKTLHALKLSNDDLYYNTSRTPIPDWQYDILKETLQKCDPNYIVPIGTRIRENDNRAKLPFWLGSMNKLRPTEEVEILRWFENHKSSEYIIESKLDGISCLLVIKKGKIKLYTRGDGEIGADISYLGKYIDGIPSNCEDINVRGELIIPISVFDEKYRNVCANARNMVAGRVGGKTLREGVSDIKFVAYEVIGKDFTKSPLEQLNKLNSLGFHTVKNNILSELDIDTLKEQLVLHKAESIYEIDGIIIQPNIPYGRNTTGNPSYAFAFKMRLDGDIYQSKVVDVKWNISKWGLLKPRVQIEPIKVGGVTITWATGFNGKFIVNNNIGVDSIVNITRSGDVIPYIINVVKGSSIVSYPSVSWHWNETCVEMIADETDKISNIKLYANFFFELGIKHIGEKNIEKLYDAGYDTIIKIISATKEQIAQVPGFGIKGAERAYNNIQNGLKNLQVSVVLGASGVFGAGFGVKKITSLMNSFPDIFEKYEQFSDEEFRNRILQVEGFSDKSVDKIIENIGKAKAFLREFSKYGNFQEKNVVNENLKKLNIVFSGFRDKFLEEEITLRGGRVSTSVSSKTNILVVSSLDNISGKVIAAQKNGVEVIEKDKFIDKYIL